MCWGGEDEVEEGRFDASGLREEDEEDEAKVNHVAAAFAAASPLKVLLPVGG